MPITSSNNGYFEVNGKRLEAHNVEMTWEPIELPTQNVIDEIDEVISKLRAKITQLWPNFTPTGPVVEGSIEETPDA